MKKRIENINITPKELKAICKEYEYKEEEYLMVDEDDNEYPILIKKALSEIDKADYIIFCLYMEYGSERKVADILNCSRTPINSTIKKVKRQIREKLCI